MRYKYLFVLAMLVALAVACSDEENIGFRHRDGYVSLAIGENRSWAEDGMTRSTVDAPMLLQCDLDGAQPLYLHTEVSPTPAETTLDKGPLTRGDRLTGPVFDNGLVTTFGIYGKAGSTYFKQGFTISSDMTKDNTSQGAVGTGDDSYWYYKEYDASDGVLGDQWGGASTADFYGYAPYFAPDAATNSNGLSITASAGINSGVPTIEYIAPSDVANQLDILTAKHTGVSKSQDVELVFDHVLSAIKFKVDNTTTIDGSIATTPSHTGLQWTDGLTVYNVTIKSVSIKGVYYHGWWKVGDEVYASSGNDDDDTNNWTRVNPSTSTEDTSTDRTFTISPATNLASASATVDVNTDNSGNVFMMLPQTTPSGAALEIICTMTPTSGSAKDVRFTLPFNGKEWKPGYTYNYTIKLSDVAYVFDFNTAKSFSTSDVPTTGKNFDIADNTNGAGFIIRSYKIDAKGNKKAVDWKLQHKEFISSVTGSNTSSQSEVWVDGSNGWMHLIDNDGSGTEVTDDPHPGAYWDESTNQPSVYKDWYYQLEIGSILTPVIDLSLYNYDQTKKWTGRSTANCYIVAGPGTYRIPLVYGNAITNGTITTSAYAPGHSASDVLSSLLNYNDAAISTPYIKKDAGNGDYTACLIWEEGDGTGTSNTGATGSTAATSGDDAKYGHQYNIGTVVKVIEAIDTYDEADDKYNKSAPFESGADYLQFEVSADNFNYGNAVIGLRKGNTIVWSWHIWITDPTTFTTNQTITLDEGHSVSLAGRNIGWVDGGISKGQEKRNGYLRLVQAETDAKLYIDADQIKRNAFTTYFTNVLYQWGRKDPMRGNVSQSDDNSDNGAPRGTAGVKPWANNFRTVTLGSSTHGQRTIGQLIQEPNTIYGVARGDLYQTVYYNLWAANLTQAYQSMWGTWQLLGKTIYDPSPVGYIVPPSRYMMTFARNGYREGFAEKTRDDQPPIICRFEHSSEVAYFYASGVRSTTNSRDLKSMGFRSPGPALLFRGALGNYHTSTPYSKDETFQLHLYFYGGDNIGSMDETDTHNKILGDMAEALSIMPMVYHFEQNMEEQEEPNEDPQENTGNSAYPSETLSRGNWSEW